MARAHWAFKEEKEAKEGKGRKGNEKKRQRYLYARSGQSKSSLLHPFREPYLVFPSNPAQPLRQTPCHNLVTFGYLKAFWGRVEKQF
jgi:hypothetical protein